MWYRPPFSGPNLKPETTVTRAFLERTTGFEPATLTLAKKTPTGEPQLPYLHLCKLMQHDRRFRLTTANRY